MSAPEVGRKLRVRCVVNAASGDGGADLERLRAAFAAAAGRQSLDYRIDACARPGEVGPALARACDERPDVLAVGGGDGTMSAAAGLLAGSATALGVLPMGTLNHFARDLGVPAEVEAAVVAICGGRTEACDLAEVNGRHFVNNASLGIYFDAVRVRERWRPRVGRLPAFVIGALTALGHFPVLKLEVELDGVRRRRRLPLLFVGNNAYDFGWPVIGGRSILAGGRLDVWMVRDGGRLPIARAALGVVFGGEPAAEQIERSAATELVVRSSRPRLRLALDGEMTSLATPLHFRVAPGALQVRLPAIGTAEESTRTPPGAR